MLSGSRVLPEPAGACTMLTSEVRIAGTKAGEAGGEAEDCGHQRQEPAAQHACGCALKHLP